MIYDRAAIEFLNDAFGFEFIGFEQDWNLEFADPNRLDDFIDFFNREELNSKTKQALMSLIIASYDDFLFEESERDNYGIKIKALIHRDFPLYRKELEYWSLDGEDDIFKVTPFIRSCINEYS